MGSLLQTFTFDRNTFRRTAEASGDSVAEHISKVAAGEGLEKVASNIVGALASYMGVFAKAEDGKMVPTNLAGVFLKLRDGNKIDSWRWLIARSLWRFVIPNGTASKVNHPAQAHGTKFAFFHSIVKLLTHLSALSGEQRFLYFEELCRLLDEDANWKLTVEELFTRLASARAKGQSGFGSQRSFLEDLENKRDQESEFKIPRDNLNGLILNAFDQTGFFQFLEGPNGRKIAMALNPDLDKVLQRRLRFIIDHPPSWNGEDWPSYLDIQSEDLPKEVTSDTKEKNKPASGPQELANLVPALKADLDACGLHSTMEQLLRLTASLEAKRFLILTGLAGSGKTKLGQAFARWITPTESHQKCYELVPVGADWTSTESVLGYPNGLDKQEYVTKPALGLILRALANAEVPHFLILDEMNLSHVERYFADILSVIESEETIPLHNDTDRKANGILIPGAIALPKNLFIIGTVNVDETTYMFSPKVLDRATVIEFRMGIVELEGFLENPAKPHLLALDGQGSSFAQAFVEGATGERAVPADVKQEYEAEMLLFFNVLREHGAEFGYRVAHEVSRFIHFYKLLKNVQEGDTSWFIGAFDCVVFQKFLPKLHGSRATLGPLLKALWFLCNNPRDYTNGTATKRQAVDVAFQQATAASISTEAKSIPSDKLASSAPYPLSAEKINRMWRLLNENGFASFAEA